MTCVTPTKSGAEGPDPSKLHRKEGLNDQQLPSEKRGGDGTFEQHLKIGRAEADLKKVLVGSIDNSACERVQ
jgi:hypothetical protein